MNNSKIISPEKKLDRNKTYLKHHSEEGGMGHFNQLTKLMLHNLLGNRYLTIRELTEDALHIE